METNTESQVKFDNEEENLCILSEEGCEVSQMVSKIFRFGIDDIWPERGISNRAGLEQEIGHFMAMVNILIEQGTISMDGISAGIQHKMDKLPRWYGYKQRIDPAPLVTALQKIKAMGSIDNGSGFIVGNAYAYEATQALKTVKLIRLADAVMEFKNG